MVRREGQRPNLNGEMEDIEYTGQELCILIADGTGREWSFMETRLRDDKVWIIGLARAGRDDEDGGAEGVPAKDRIDFTLQELIQHFIIPDVPDVASVNPEAFRHNLKAIDEIESLCP